MFAITVKSYKATYITERSIMKKELQHNQCNVILYGLVNLPKYFPQNIFKIFSAVPDASAVLPPPPLPLHLLCPDLGPHLLPQPADLGPGEAAGLGADVVQEGVAAHGDPVLLQQLELPGQGGEVGLVEQPGLVELQEAQRHSEEEISRLGSHWSRASPLIRPFCAWKPPLCHKEPTKGKKCS